MERLILGVLLLFVGSNSFFACKKEDSISVELSRVVINNYKIDSMINTVICDNNDYLKQDDCFLLLGLIKNDNDTNYINIVVYEKKKFAITCPENDYPLFGYFEFNNQTFLVVGEFFIDETLLLNEKKIFTFKCRDNWETWDKPHPSPPPSMYNPPNYFFVYE
ncbi:MAG: hypothetical protein EZS26_001296 [Candidatus Ordinivivax streblomastigis]|uniref:Lipoprotein n=1 Tax=Candidatus Ordinivivax streblomastigis TaxID=2540710 RepID=A0A5M8P244_9BACT|nr:MAG: hypothetical protein EZS26_001296 [Candidatus Ordinivivax streblomastigis]